MATGMRSAGRTSSLESDLYVHGIRWVWCAVGKPAEKHAVAETVVAKAGQHFEIVLEGTPGSGFTWQWVRPVEKTGVVEELGEDIEPSTTLAGGAAKQHFRFRALAAGEVKLHFVYRRSWESKAPLEEREFVVKVGP